MSLNRKGNTVVSIVGQVDTYDVRANDTLNIISGNLENNNPEYDGIGLKVNGGMVRNGKRFTAIPIIGRKNQIYTYETSAVPLIGSFGTERSVYYPLLEENLQLASDNAGDTDTVGGTGARKIRIQGIDGSGNFIIEDVILTGQTPVSTINSFFRVSGFAVIESYGTTLLNGSNLGDIFLASETATFTLGVPNEKNLILGVMGPALGVGDTGSFYMPPGSELYFSELVISSTVGNKDENLIVSFRGKQGNSGWRNFGRLNISSATSVVSLHQGGFPNINTDLSGLLGQDIQLTVSREGIQPSDNISINIYLTGILVVDV